MKHALRLTVVFLCLCLLPLCACKKKEEIDVDPVDPETLKRPVSLEATIAESELPELLFEVVLKDSYQLPVAEAEISLSAEGLDEPIKATTDENGAAVFSPKLSEGSHEVVFGYEGSKHYRKASFSVTLTAIPRENRSGVYVRGRDLSSIDLAELGAAGVGNLFLHQEVLTSASHKNIEEFIAAAKKEDIRVHLWLITLYDAGEFVVPIVGNNYNQEYFDAEAEKVREAASLEGLYGLHFDYIRYDSEEVRADRFRSTSGDGGEGAITEFVRQMVLAARAVNPDLVFSGATMPQYGVLIAKYGQDLEDLSQYFDFFVPMLYAGNYGEDEEWIAEWMRLYRQKHPRLDLRPALLTYRSDVEQINKTEEELKKELELCYAEGADGAVLFYYDRGVTTLVSPEPAAK